MVLLPAARIFVHVPMSLFPCLVLVLCLPQGDLPIVNTTTRSA